MKKSILIMLIFTLSMMLTGCNFIGKQMKEQKAEGMIKEYYQAIIDEDYEKAFQQLHLYDYVPEKENQDLRNGTELSVDEAKEFYLKKIDFLKDQNYKLNDFEIVKVEYEDGHSFWHHIKVKGEQNGENFEWIEFADIYEGELLIGGSDRNDPYAKYRDGKMNFEIEELEKGTQETQEKEVTILSETSFIAQDGTENTATLYYDGDIRLSVNGSQTVIASNVSEDSLGYYNDSSVPINVYSVETFGEQPFIAVKNDFSTVSGPNVKLDLFTYLEPNLKPVFSTSDIHFELDAIDYEKGEVTFSLPFANTTVTHVLTSKERAQTEDKLLEFKNNNVTIDGDYIKSIKNNIISRPIEVALTDTDDDGVEEMLITSTVKAVGARTPVKIYTKAIFVFELMNNEIQFKAATFESVQK